MTGASGSSGNGDGGKGMGKAQVARASTQPRSFEARDGGERSKDGAARSSSLGLRLDLLLVEPQRDDNPKKKRKRCNDGGASRSVNLGRREVTAGTKGAAAAAAAPSRTPDNDVEAGAAMVAIKSSKLAMDNIFGAINEAKQAKKLTKAATSGSSGGNGGSTGGAAFSGPISRPPKEHNPFKDPIPSGSRWAWADEVKPVRYDEERLPIYTAASLRIGRGGGTDLCPFDCDCCF
ncbi:unnamed protein product [Phaeothamnion confervicola]